jgi:hypothetical protein
MNVMRAVRAAGLSAPVVNCSYPDVTHPVLARLGLAPTIGIGNIGMIRELVIAALKRTGREPPLVRVLGHHAHVTPAVTCDEQRCGDAPRPHVYLGDSGDRADEVVFAGAPIVPDRNLNALTAVHALSIVRALLSDGVPLRTSAPSPAGLPGGFPVSIRAGDVALDLPSSLSLEAALDFQIKSARLDGVDSIRDDGTVVFTEASQLHLRDLAGEVAEPLHPDAALTRFALLTRALEGSFS